MAITPDRSATAGPVRLALACVTLAVTVFAFAATAQETPAQETPPKKKIKPYALIFGTVFGPDAHARYGVPVKIRRADQKKTLWEGMSDHRGEFAARLAPGPVDYIVWADIKTPKGEPKPETKVHFEADERIDIGLHLKQ